MADSNAPVYIPLTGVITQMNPTAPPPAAVHCHNFRVMPSVDGSLWLRLFGGRVLRKLYDSGTWRQFHEYRDPFYAGYLNQLGQWVDGTVVKWKRFWLNDWFTEDVLTIDTVNFGGSFVRTRRAPICNVDDGIVIYNGLGVRDPSAGSKPPFTLYLANNGLQIYLGLDCFIPLWSMPPFLTPTTGDIKIVNEITVYVGLFNTLTYHFSNAVKCGTVTAGENLGITIGNLGAIKMHNHGPFEQGLQKYVFFATVDLENAEVGYLMMDPNDPTLPLMANMGDPSYTINNYLLDVFKEAPIENHPPRPMRWIAYVEGRIYGGLLPEAGQSPSLPDFSYVPPTHYLPGIVWSAAASDVSETFFLGAPEHAFPLDNFKSTPNTEQPIWGARSPEGKSLHVITETSNFIVFEDIDERHTFTEIPGRYGIRNTSTYCERTPHGSIWETQNGEIVALDENARIDILSRPYQDKLRGKVSRCATHTLDPPNMIDRYELYFTDGTVWIHDFVTGQGYSADGDFTAARTLMDQTTRRFHICANRDFFTQAGQPDDPQCRERVKDEIVEGASTVVQVRRTGEHETHWIDFGDPSSIGNIAETHVHGDVRSGNLAIHAWRDHEEPLDGTAIPNIMHSAIFTAANYMATVGKALLGTVFTLKLRTRLIADAVETWYPTMYEYGRLALSKTMVGIVGKIGFVLRKGSIRLQ